MRKYIEIIGLETDLKEQEHYEEMGLNIDVEPEEVRVGLFIDQIAFFREHKANNADPNTIIVSLIDGTDMLVGQSYNSFKQLLTQAKPI